MALDDVIYALEQSINLESQVYDIGGPDVLSYRGLMQVLAQQMNVKRHFIKFPLFTVGLSRLWVQLVTGASRNLVAPLVESLKHEMIVEEKNGFPFGSYRRTSLVEALRKCIASIVPTLRGSTRARKAQGKTVRDVRSLQRLPLPRGKNAQWVAAEYVRWLPRFLLPAVKVTMKADGTWHFNILFFSKPILILKYSPERSTPDRQLFYIVGGSLVSKENLGRGRLEFREVLDGTAILAAIHEFRPNLPWYLYNLTQAQAHLWVMRNFKRRLAAL